MAKKFLDQNGVQILWNKTKEISFKTRYNNTVHAAGGDSVYSYQLIAKLRTQGDLGNGGSLLISGTLGSYEYPNKIDAAIITRDGFKAIGSKNIVSISSLDRANIEIYLDSNNSSYSVYLRTKAYVSYNLSINVNGGILLSINKYLPSSTTTKPAGTLTWSLESDTSLIKLSTIPTVNNPKITITQGGATKGSFTLNQTNSQTIALDAGGSSSSGPKVIKNTASDINSIGGMEALLRDHCFIIAYNSYYNLMARNFTVFVDVRADYKYLTQIAINTEGTEMGNIIENPTVLAFQFRSDVYGSSSSLLSYFKMNYFNSGMYSDSYGDGGSISSIIVF